MSEAQIVAPRQCGRCRLSFEGDPSLTGGTQQEWWLCPSCRSILLPPRGKARR